MNREEKSEVIKAFCTSWGSCSTDKPEPCPLYTIIGECYDVDDDEIINRNYDILLEHGLLTLPETDTEDIINHPNHYTNGGMECIDEMLLVFGKRVVADFCLCNAWKYRYRALSKNGQEDIDKSHWYMAKYKEIMDEVREYDESI